MGFCYWSCNCFSQTFCTFFLIFLADSDNFLETFNKNLCNVLASLIPFLILSFVTGNKGYELSQSEKEYLAPLWEALFLKYLPAMRILKYEEEITLAIVIFGLIIKKTFQDKLLPTPELARE